MLKPATRDDVENVRNAILHLRMAVALLHLSPKAHAKAHAALKSAEGAERHMLRRWRATKGE